MDPEIALRFPPRALNGGGATWTEGRVEQRWREEPFLQRVQSEGARMESPFTYLHVSAVRARLKAKFRWQRRKHNVRVFGKNVSWGKKELFCGLQWQLLATRDRFRQHLDDHAEVDKFVNFEVHLDAASKPCIIQH